MCVWKTHHRTRQGKILRSCWFHGSAFRRMHSRKYTMYAHPHPHIHTHIHIHTHTHIHTYARACKISHAHAHAHIHAHLWSCNAPSLRINKYTSQLCERTASISSNLERPLSGHSRYGANAAFTYGGVPAMLSVSKCRLASQSPPVVLIIYHHNY